MYDPATRLFRIPFGLNDKLIEPEVPPNDEIRRAVKAVLERYTNLDVYRVQTHLQAKGLDVSLSVIAGVAAGL